MGNGFGLDNTEETWKEYIGQYVIIYPAMSHSTFSGKMVGIEEGYAVLNPFQGGSYDKEKGLIRKMIHRNSRVSLVGVVGIEPSTLRDIEAYCKFSNRQSELEREKAQKQDKNRNC